MKHMHVFKTFSYFGKFHWEVSLLESLTQAPQYNQGAL